jgi:hypothetical protein
VTALGSGSAGGDSWPAGASESANRAKSGSECHPALAALSEAQFQRIVRAHLTRFGYVVWVVPNMKLTTAGLPDILAWHPDRPGVLHAWELKGMRTRITDKQLAAYRHLQTVPGVDARIVRPSDWEALRDALIEEMR